MIDVKLTNSKLLERGTLIVQDFTNVEYDSAKMAILRSIHESDQVDLDITSKVQTTNISATSHQPYYPLYLRVRRNLSFSKIIHHVTNILKDASFHIGVASSKKLVVPRAILLASGTETIQKANDILAAEPVVRKAIVQATS